MSATSPRRTAKATRSGGWNLWIYSNLKHLGNIPTIYVDLLVGLEHEWIMTFHILGDLHHPNWRVVIFFRGVGIPPTSNGYTTFFWTKKHCTANHVPIWETLHYECGLSGWQSHGIQHRRFYWRVFAKGQQRITLLDYCCLVIARKCRFGCTLFPSTR